MSVYQPDLVVVSSTMSNGRRDLSCTQSMTYRRVTLHDPHQTRSQHLAKSRSPHVGVSHEDAVAIQCVVIDKDI